MSIFKSVTLKARKIEFYTCKKGLAFNPIHSKNIAGFLTSGPVRQVLAVTFLLLLLLLRVFIPEIKLFWIFKSFIRFILNILEYFLSKLVQTCQNLSKLVQTCQNWTKLFQISPNLSKSVQTCSIQFKIVRISLKFSKSVLTS